MKTKSILNAKTMPQVFYGMHFEPGVALYRPKDKKPFMLYISERVIKEMDPSFQGKPLYTMHIDHVDLENLQQEADGYVIESFFNKYDGKTWAKFIIISDRGHDAIRNGWKLSNGYNPRELAGAGEWHGVPFDHEIMRGEYYHMALVPKPRYESSVIMTPDQFKEYNDKKKQELHDLKNSKESNNTDNEENNSVTVIEIEGDSMNFFKRTKIDNAADLENTMVILPKSKQEKTISQIVNELDGLVEKQKEPQVANGDHFIEVGGEKMTVNELIEKHESLKNELDELKKGKEGEGAEGSKNNEADDEAKKKAEEEKKKKEAEGVKNAADEKAKKEEEARKKTEGKAYFDAIKNAADQAAGFSSITETVDTSMDQVARGKSRYGSC